MLSPEDAILWKKKKEEEEKKKEDEERKENRLAFLLAIPDCLVNTSTFVHGIKDIASGSRDSVFALSTMMRGIPSVLAWRRDSASESRSEGQEIITSALGTGTLGLRTVVDRQILTRAYDGSIAVIDDFGPKKQRVSRNLMGTRLVATMAELERAISDFKCGKLSQLVDIDRKLVSLLTAHRMWCRLCSQNLTGILRENSPMPEMALRATRILEEERAVKSQLDDMRNATSGLESLTLGLRDKLEGKHPKEKSD